MESKICIHCGKRFERGQTTSRTQFKNQKCCSNACANRARDYSKINLHPNKSIPEEVICACGCGERFEKKIYKKGKITYFYQSRHFLNKEHFMRDFKYQRAVEEQEYVRRYLDES